MKIKNRLIFLKKIDNKRVRFFFSQIKRRPLKTKQKWKKCIFFSLRVENTLNKKN